MQEVLCGCEEKGMQYLTIALTKGRLAGQTMELFEKAGFFCEELKDKKSRKLIFTNEEQVFGKKNSD